MIQSGGQLVLADASPMPVNTTYYANTGLNLTALFASYGLIYRRQLWVYTLVRKRALATCRLPLKVYQRRPDGREENRDTDYARLLREPNPRMSGTQLWEWTSSTDDIYGEAIWLKVRGRDRRPAEVWPIHPSNIAIRPVRDEAEAEKLSLPIGSLLYIYSPGIAIGADPNFVIPEADVVHFKSYSPDSTIRGLSALEPLRQTLVNEDAARRASSAFWANGARPSTYLTHPNKLSDGALQRLKSQWDAIHAGVDNFGKTAVLEEGMEPHTLSLTAEESQYIESRKLNREECCAAYDMPPPAVHILDRATFNNITEQFRSVYRDTMAPKLGGYEATLDHQLRPEFAGDDTYAEFLMDEVLRGAFEDRAASIQAAINSGQLTPNEARSLDNRPAMPGGDRLFINSTMVPIEAAGTVAPPPLVTQARSLDPLWGRLGSCSLLDDIDPDVLTAGLNGVSDTVRALLDESRANGESVSEFRARVRAALP